ncbi:MAG: type II secretion system protein [bacterium]|nr:type II secretion system protein [bacterium]
MKFRKKMQNYFTRIGESIHDTRYTIHDTRAFTLIETMVAISLLTIAIVAPMSLTTQSLSSAYYARDQITAFHLAQEAIESVRHARDRNVLKNALGVTTDLLAGLPSSGTPFTIDTTNNDLITTCSGTCPVLRKSTEGLYGYSAAWSPTYFTRTVTATFVPGSGDDEITVLVRVDWQTGGFNSRNFTISDNLFRWVRDSSAVG